MKYAIVESGSRQYRVSEDAVIEVDLLAAEVGDTVDLPVLLLAAGDSYQIGKPRVAGASVKATVVAHGRGPKIRVFKYKPKQRYRRTSGQRQSFTRLHVNQIVG